MEGVTLLGSVTDMPAFFHGIDVLCFPSLREGLPNVVIEAAACQVPTVAWRVTGLEDAVRDGETGFLSAYGDLESMIQNITTLLRQDSKRLLFGSAARRHAEEYFAADAVQARKADDLVAQVVAAARD
jgi:glycosyltransferase involved in cell wall biosynthesis